jgi:hypothetical protein
VTGRQLVALGVTTALAGSALTAGLFVALGQSGTETADARGRNEVAANGTVQGELYPGAPDAEAMLVSQENDRVEAVRAVAATAEWNDLIADGPFRITSEEQYTLVLPGRPEPYTVGDLLSLAPDTFTDQGGGVFQLAENLVVMNGATLALDAGTELRLLSTPARFVSVVGLGGTIDFSGAADAPVRVTSWDPDSGAADTLTSDGRAYLRAVGGYVALDRVEVSDLGFWSGNTGGLSFTGTGGEVSPVGVPAEQRDAPAPVAGAQTLGEEIAEVAVTDDVDLSSVSADVTDVTVRGNAYGMFVANASDVTIRHSLVSESLVDGIAFHRHVTSSTVADTTSRDNAVDGVSLARSSREVLFTGLVSTGNARNGLSLDAQPLADGPSAIGTMVADFGDNEVRGGMFRDNARYGIEIAGGSGTRVSDAVIRGNDSGIVVAREAGDVAINANQIVDNATQGVAVRDGVRGVEIADNVITGGATGIYVRNAAAEIEDNVLTEILRHGVSLVGDASEVLVRRNDIAGSGTLAVWDEQSEGARLLQNDTDDWVPAATLPRVLADVFQPLTLVWLTLALVLVVTASTRRGGQFQGVRHPYADQVPLTSLTRGVVSRDSVGM